MKGIADDHRLVHLYRTIRDLQMGALFKIRNQPETWKAGSYFPFFTDDAVHWSSKRPLFPRFCLISQPQFSWRDQLVVKRIRLYGCAVSIIITIDESGQNRVFTQPIAHFTITLCRDYSVQNERSQGVGDWQYSYSSWSPRQRSPIRNYIWRRTCYPEGTDFFKKSFDRS